MQKIKKNRALEELAAKGEVPFFLDGEPTAPASVYALAQDSLYMADYVVGEEGKVVEVRFDRIDLP